MKYLLLLALLLCGARGARAQESDTKLIFHVTTSKTYVKGAGHKSDVSAIDFLAIIIFKRNEVRFNTPGKSIDTDVVFPVTEIQTVNKRRSVYAYRCADRTFTLDVPHQTVTVSYSSDYVTNYYGHYGRFL